MDIPYLGDIYHTFLFYLNSGSWSFPRRRSTWRAFASASPRAVPGGAMSHIKMRGSTQKITGGSPKIVWFIHVYTGKSENPIKMIIVIGYSYHKPHSSTFFYGFKPHYHCWSSLIHMEVSINGGTPIAGWFILWKIPRKNGWFRGTPFSRKYERKVWKTQENLWMGGLIQGATQELHPNKIRKVLNSNREV